MRIIFIALTISLSTLCFGQKFKVDIVYQSGSVESRINFVILPDGYTSQEFGKFTEDVQKFITTFLATPPFKQYKHYFNFFAIEVPSEESGANHPGTATDVSEPAHPVLKTNNYFSSTFDYYQIHRLLVATDVAKVYQVSADNFPMYDHVIIIVNSEYYGGSGGDYSTASTHPYSSEVTLHELGHSFGRLADEYYAGDFYAQEKVNMTKETDPEKVRWKNWIGTDDVGVYQHCCGESSALWYRPHQNCKMRTLNAPFCPVCTQALVERIHTLAPTLESYTPKENTIEAGLDSLVFSVNNIPVEPNTIRVAWEVNGTKVASGQDTLVVFPDLFEIGTNKVVVLVEDTTNMVRVDDHASLHLNKVEWIVQKSHIGKYDISSSAQRFSAKIYPNPAFDKLNILIESEGEKNISMIVSDASGQKVLRKAMKQEKAWTVDISSWAKGAYFVAFYSGNTALGVRKVVVE